MQVLLPNFMVWASSSSTQSPCREDGKKKKFCVIFCLYQTRPPQLEMHHGVGLALTLGRRGPTSSHREGSPAQYLLANEASAQWEGRVGQSCSLEQFHQLPLRHCCSYWTAPHPEQRGLPSDIWRSKWQGVCHFLSFALLPSQTKTNQTRPNQQTHRKTKK